MRKALILLNLIALLFTAGNESANAQRKDLEVPAEVTEVRNVGLSARDESKSIIEVHWRIGQAQREKAAHFNLILFVTYADGTAISEKRKILNTALTARLEVPSVKTFGRSSAFIKKMKATVTAVLTK